MDVARSVSPIKARFSRLTNGCAWNAVSAFANCGRAVAHVRGSYVPEGDIKNPMLRQCAVINPIDAAPPRNRYATLDDLSHRLVIA